MPQTSRAGNMPMSPRLLEQLIAVRVQVRRIPGLVNFMVPRGVANFSITWSLTRVAPATTSDLSSRVG